MGEMRKKGRPGYWFRVAFMVLLDGLVIAMALLLSILLRYEGAVPPSVWERLPAYMLLICPLYFLVLIGIRAYNTLWYYVKLSQVLYMSAFGVLAGLVTVAVNSIFRLGLSNLILLITCMLAFYLLVIAKSAPHLCRSLARKLAKGDVKRKREPTIIVGAGSAGRYCVDLLKNRNNIDGRPCLFVDDDPEKQGMILYGFPVRGQIRDIPELVSRYSIQNIIIAIPSLSSARLREVLQICQGTGCTVRILYRLQKSNGNGETRVDLRDMDISDFLPRREIKLDTDSICGYLKDRVVLVTGGGGSIGAELCRQILRFSPKQLLLFDIYENSAYELACQMRDQYGPDVPLKILIGSIRDKSRMEQVMEEYRPQVLFHAAAHKHVPLMEINPLEAIKNNVLGTRNVLEAASAHGVERFVQISTDKAVNPTNIMGATKRVTELLIQIYAQKSAMQCVAVRFGNVLGSHGSVIPIMEAQIRRGGPVLVTHPEITRYFMTPSEAAQLVLQAGSMAKSGTIYLLDMGNPVKILDLAKQLIRFYGYEPETDIEIKFIGLRPGEKLYEELALAEEKNEYLETAHNRIMQLSSPHMDVERLGEGIDRLISLALACDREGAIEELKRIVPNYKRTEREEKHTAFQGSEKEVSL